MNSETIVTAGIDTHTDVHVAAVLDQSGRLLGTKSFPATTRGYTKLATWTESFGRVEKIGMEGTGSFGAGLLRFLTDHGLTVIEVDRPDRSDRRRNGKSDPLDSDPLDAAAAQIQLVVLQAGVRGAVKVSQIGRRDPGTQTSTGAARPATMEKPRLKSVTRPLGPAADAGHGAKVKPVSPAGSGLPTPR
jgi:Transposase